MAAGTDELEEQADDEIPRGWRERLGGALFLVTGAALVIHIVFGLPLWLTVFGGVAIAALVLSWLASMTGADLGRPVRIGLAAGAAATVSYDLSRLAAVELLSLQARPFEAWRHFGAALVGSGAPGELRWLAGTAFHLTNGLAFAVAYTYWFAPKGPLAGIAFGLVLESFMLGLYPGWLNLSSYAPFVVMSLIGHVFYGTVLGLLARRWWIASERV